MNSTDTKPWRISVSFADKFPLAAVRRAPEVARGCCKVLRWNPQELRWAACGRDLRGICLKNKINWKVSEPPANTAYSRTVFAVFFGVSVKVPQIGRNPRRLMPGSPEIAAGCLLCIVLGELRHAEKIYRPPHRAVSFRAFHRLVVQQSRPVASTTRIHLLWL